MLKVKFKNSKNLLRVLGTVDNILKKNKTDTKLKHIKLEKVNDKLCLIARNSYMRLDYIIEDTINIEGDSTLYDYKTFISLLNVLDDEITIDNNIIKSKKCKYTIPTINPEGYPEDLTPQVENRKEINTDIFKDALESVFCATQKGGYETALSGVYINTDKIVACDQNRIFIKELDTILDNVILSKEMVNELLRLPFKDKMFMSIFGNNIIFEDENLYIASNFIAKDYPKYEQLIPTENINEIAFKNKDLEDALNLMMPVLNQSTFKCGLEITTDEMIIFVDNDTKKAKTVIPIYAREEIDKPIKVMFNINYLTDMLKVNDEEILLCTHKAPGYTFKSEKGLQYIMPMIN